jgi:hypothetical protein
MDEKKPVGRPSEYDPKYADMLLEYFDVPPYVEQIKKLITKKGEVIEVPTDVPSDFPTLAGFAIKLGVHRDTLLEWSKTHPEFSGAYKRAKDFQEHYLTVNGNKGLIDTAFGIFTAKNVLKWRDRQPGEEDKININLSLADRISQARSRSKK